MTPYILVFALFFAVVAYGLHRRPLWAWWGGWGIFFLTAGYWGSCTFSVLYYAETGTATLHAAIYIAGGAVLWIPSAVWWSGRRSFFGQTQNHQHRNIQDASND